MSIQSLNDEFRRTFEGGKVMVSRAILNLLMDTQVKIEEAVRNFDDFNERNDPHGEHDFGIVVVDGVKVYFKIEYYDAECIYRSQEPSNPAVTTRVMTIFKAEEY